MNQQPTRRPIRRRRLWLIFSLVASGLAVAAAFLYLRARSDQPAASVLRSPSSSPSATASPTPEPVRIRLIGSGDQLPHEAIVRAARTAAGGYSFVPFFDGVASIANKSDIRFCNQEAPSAGDTLPVTGYPAFNAPVEFAQVLSAIGCNVVSLANNHTNDKGQAGIQRTVEVWDALRPLAHSGANRTLTEQQTVRTFTLKGIRFAFVAFSESSNSRVAVPYAVNMLDTPTVTALMKQATAAADYVIVSAHWGTEYSAVPNAAQKRWAQTLSDLGADVIFGTGPHVLQPVETISSNSGRQTVVWYSLGNLLSAQLDTESLIGGFAMMDFVVQDTKPVLTKTAFVPTYMHYEWTPAQKAAEDLLARRNFGLFYLHAAQTQLDTSLLGASVEAQIERVRQIMQNTTLVDGTQL